MPFMPNCAYEDAAEGETNEERRKSNGKWNPGDDVKITLY
jgi:hypothetical protein